MKNRILSSKFVPLISFTILASLSLNSCDLIFKVCPTDDGVLCKFLAKAPIRELTDTSSTVVREAVDTLIIVHGTGCSKSDRDGTQDMILAHAGRELPPYVTDAAVFLNGWNHKYLSSDHHFAGAGIVIINISFDSSGRNKLLKWDVAGAMSDDDFNDPYSMCYHYTVVGWNRSTIDINIDQDDGACDTINLVESNYFETNNSGTTTALSSFPSFLKSPNFIPGNAVVILPRGFAFAWNNCDDHHFLQIGYNLEHNEGIMKDQDYKKGRTTFNPSFPENVSKMDSGFTSWDTYTVYKDNDDRRGYRFGEMVSGMSGSDVRIIQPPYSFLPKGTAGACAGKARTEEFIIERIPFEYAVPVLSGWNLGYSCTDHHMTNIGIWIDEWSYVKDPSTNLGTLRYKLSSAFEDKNGDDPNFRTHKVTVLGLRDVIPGKSAGGKFADLIPFSPVGSVPFAFCRRENLGKDLRVTIRNQGTANAGPSKTTVVFGNVIVTLDTPAIPAGGSADLLFLSLSIVFVPIAISYIKVDSQIRSTKETAKETTVSMEFVWDDDYIGNESLSKHFFTTIFFWC